MENTYANIVPVIAMDSPSQPLSTYLYSLLTLGNLASVFVQFIFCASRFMLSCESVSGLIGLCARRASTHMKITIEQAVEIQNANLLAASIQDEIRQAKDQAADMGERAGKNAAEWVAQDTWGGRVTHGEKEAASEFLRAFDDGELDLTPPDLSGEWADSETPASLMCAVFGDNWEETPEFVDAQDEICAAWEIAAQDAFYSTLCHSAQSILE